MKRKINVIHTQSLAWFYDTNIYTYILRQQGGGGPLLPLKRATASPGAGLILWI